MTDAGGLVSLPMKPFLADREAFAKQNRPSVPARSVAGAIMLVFILNAIYREFLRASISGAKVAGG